MSIYSEINRIGSAAKKLAKQGSDWGLNDGVNDITENSKIDKVADAFATVQLRNVTGTVEIQEGETQIVESGYYKGFTIAGVPGGGNYALYGDTEVTPTKTSQTITKPTLGNWYGLSQVVVKPIPDSYQNVTSVTATASDVLATKTIVTASGAEVVGTMPNIGAVSQTLSTTKTSYTVPAGYHSGSGSVSISLETKSATPAATAQDITPSTGKVLSKVTVNAIPSNWGDATGKTVTASSLLSGITAIGENADGEAVTVTGTMANNGATGTTGLLAGDSYTIPAGYTSGGTVSAATLASQTGVATGKTAIGAAQVLSGYEGWVNGEKVTGTMANRGSFGSTVLDTTKTQKTFDAGYYSIRGGVSISLEEKTATPTEEAQDITPTSGKVLSKVTVNAIPGNYMDASGTNATAANILSGKTAIGYDSATGKAKTLTGTMTDLGMLTKTLWWGQDADSYKRLSRASFSSAIITVASEAVDITPSEEQQVIFGSEIAEGTTGDHKFINKATVAAIPSDYVGSSIARITSSSSTKPSASGATVTSPAGYYASALTTTVSSGALATPVLDKTTGKVSSKVGTTGWLTTSATATQLSLTTQAAKTVTPTESSQTAVAADRYTLGAVTVAAIPNNYVGSAISKLAPGNQTFSAYTEDAQHHTTDNSYTVAAGYYASSFTVTLDDTIENALKAI